MNAAAHTLPGQDILALPGLANGSRMTQQEITEAVGRSWNQVREEIYHLVINRHLVRICGIASSPARYHLPD